MTSPEPSVKAHIVSGTHFGDIDARKAFFDS